MIYNNPYQFYQSPYQSPVMQNPNLMQPQQVTHVNGKASVDTIQLAPNSSILVMDTTAPMVWLCVSDGVGKVISTPDDITPHQDKPEVDYSSFENRLAKLEKTISEMEVRKDAKSDGAKFNAKQNQ